jgi:hypothetical protein
MKAWLKGGLIGFGVWVILTVTYLLGVKSLISLITTIGFPTLLFEFNITTYLIVSAFWFIIWGMFVGSWIRKSIDKGWWGVS